MRIRNVAAAGLLAAAGLVAVTAQPAAASVTDCVYGSDLSRNLMSATCSTTLPDRWYLKLTCERFGDSKQFPARGSLVYGPGRGTSIAQCGSNTEIVGTAIGYL